VIHIVKRAIGLLIFSIIAITASAPLAFPGEQTERVSEEDFLAWVKERAIPLDTLDWQKVDLEPLGILDEMLDGKRIVYLGEPDHYIHEKNEFRLILIRYLVERGWNQIGMEMGLSDAKKMDRYLATGDGAILDRVAIYGYDGDARADRDDSVQGLTDDSNPEFRKKATAESRWFLSQLRLLNESIPEDHRRLRWFGYDVSFKPGGGYADAARILESHAAHPLVREITRRLARVEGESRLEESKRLLDLVAFVRARREGLGALLGDGGFLDLKRSIHCLADSFRLIDAIRIKSDAPERLAALAEREKTMFRQMDETIARLPSEEKIILLGHLMHLSKESDSLEAGGFTMWPSIGTHLHKKLPGEVFAIWMLFDRGRHGNIHVEGAVENIGSPRGAIERIFARAGPRYLLPFHSGDRREAYLGETHTLLLSGAPGRTALADQADAVFFVAEVTESAER